MKDREWGMGNGERGMALFLTLVVLSILSVLAVAGFFLARLELASGRNLREGVRALVRAESGVGDAIRGWNAGLFDSLPVGIDTVLAEPPAPGWGNRRILTRLRNNLFLLRSEAIRLHTTGDTLARREVAAFLQVITPVPVVRAAISVTDSFFTGAGTRISGVDTVPPGWTGCGPPDTARAGVMMADTTALIRGPCAGPGCMSGVPPLIQDPLFSPQVADSFGGISYSQLAGHSSLTVSGTPFTMPAPSGHAIIHSRGDLALTGGTGQGVLLVDGDLTLGGGAWFAGLVRVRGILHAGPGGGTVLGAVRARGADLSGPGVLKIAYSACVLRRVSAAARRPFPLSGYWWWEVP